MALARAQTGPQTNHLLHLFPCLHLTRDAVCRLWVGRTHCLRLLLTTRRLTAYPQLDCSGLWRGVARRGVAWRGVARRSAAQRGVAWRGVAWRGVAH